MRVKYTENFFGGLSQVGIFDAIAIDSNLFHMVSRPQPGSDVMDLIGGTFNYIIFDNPVSTTTVSVLSKTASAVAKGFKAVVPKETTIVRMDPEPLWKLAGSSSNIVRLAGLSGALAVGLGAYGAHSILPDPQRSEEDKKVFETANRYHFIHTMALLGAPLCRYPSLTGSLLIIGMTLFCGTCYIGSLKKTTNLRKLTPIGGTCLIIGWLSMSL